MSELSKRDLKFFEIAKRVSKKSNHHRHKLGCVLVKKRELIGFGYNQMRTHPKAYTKYKTIHAEFHSILGLLPDELYNAIAYVYRETRDGVLAMAKPCQCCEKMFRDLNIKRVYYTIENGYGVYDLE
jgi:deoxycytidylate deaminase